MSDSKVLLFSPLTIRDVTFPNRVVLSPMMQYRATEGFVSDWHLVHMGKFALGGLGTIMTEVTAVEARGRISHGDLGIWSDDYVPGLRRLVDFIKSQGSLAAIQIGHAGRKGAMQRPWEGNGPLDDRDAARGEPAWQLVGPVGEALDSGYGVPHALSVEEIDRMSEAFADAATRADAAGFDVLEIHGAHGYLIASYLSPLVNRRTDAYGGSLENRMRIAIEIATRVRARWPEGKPLFFRISVDDGGGEGGWSIADSVILAARLKALGVDVIDCSSGGLRSSATLQGQVRGPGYQVPYAAEIKRHADISTMAVGLILDGTQAEAILQSGDADFIAVGRQAMYNPYWAHHARQQLAPDSGFHDWNPSAGWWLSKRSQALSASGYTQSGSVNL